MLLSYSLYLSLSIAAVSLPLILLLCVWRKWKLGPLRPGWPLAVVTILSLAFVFVTGSRGRYVYVVHSDFHISTYLSVFGGTYQQPGGISIKVRGKKPGTCTVINLSARRLEVDGEGPLKALGGDTHVGPGHMDVFKCPRIDFFPLTQSLEIITRGRNRPSSETWYWLLAEEPQQAEEDFGSNEEFQIMQIENIPGEDWEEVPLQESPAPVPDVEMETEE